MFDPVTTMADCKAAAQFLNLPTTSVFKYQANAGNRLTVPYGCYYYPENTGDYRLFLNLYGYKNVNSMDIEHKSICAPEGGKASPPVSVVADEE